jgi:hypothetical protein
LLLVSYGRKSFITGLLVSGFLQQGEFDWSGPPGKGTTVVSEPATSNQKPVTINNFMEPLLGAVSRRVLIQPPQ